MNSSGSEHPKPISARGKLLVLSCVAIGFGSQIWPGALVYERGIDWLGNPPHEGFVGIFLPNLLLYTTASACLCAIFWFILSRPGLLPLPAFGKLRRSLGFGIIAGLVVFALVVPLAWLTLPRGSVRWIPPNGWNIAGNLFSNFYEEFIFRGFILTGLRVVVGFWPAALISSAAWALLHAQYPLPFRIFIALTGVLFCWLVKRTGSLSSAYVAHMVADALGDSLIG
jgi:membrane protease YdiL (CAAX protease family)